MLKKVITNNLYPIRPNLEIRGAREVYTKVLSSFVSSNSIPADIFDICEMAMEIHNQFVEFKYSEFEDRIEFHLWVDFVCAIGDTIEHFGGDSDSFIGCKNLCDLVAKVKEIARDESYEGDICITWEFPKLVKEIKNSL